MAQKPGDRMAFGAIPPLRLERMFGVTTFELGEIADQLNRLERFIYPRFRQLYERRRTPVPEARNTTEAGATPTIMIPGKDRAVAMRPISRYDAVAYAEKRKCLLLLFLCTL
jgi:hypothetical protein